MFQWFFHGQKSFFFWFQKSRKSGKISIFSDFRPFQAKDVKKTTFWTLFCDAPSPVTAWFLPTLQAFLAMKKRTRRTVILFLPAPFRDEILRHETNFSDLKSVHFFEMRLPRPHSSAQKNLTRTTVKRHLDSPNHCHRPLSDEPKTPPDDMKKSGSDAPWLISHDSHLAGLACARKTQNPGGCVLLDFLPQKTSCDRGGGFCHLLRRTHGHHVATPSPTLGPHVDDIVGTLDDVQIVLDDDDRVALID